MIGAIYQDVLFVGIGDAFDGMVEASNEGTHQDEEGGGNKKINEEYAGNVEGADMVSLCYKEFGSYRVNDAHHQYGQKDAHHIMDIGIPYNAGMDTHEEKDQEGNNNIHKGVNKKWPLKISWNWNCLTIKYDKENEAPLMARSTSNTTHLGTDLA